MICTHRRHRLVLACGVTIALVGLSTSTALAQGGERFFEEKIRPVLVKHCYECHASDAESISGEYTLDSRDGMRAGGTSGVAAVVPGDPATSQLLDALRYTSYEMPPEGKLSDEVIADFERWIMMGAADPRDVDPATLRREADARKARELWSLQPAVDVAPPAVDNESWPATTIDRFVLARLEEQGLAPGHDASPSELLRRVYFDLIGLPPSLEELQRFVRDPSPQAFEKTVDELLDSPRFGERWGRHWLDLARYAESSGMEFNFTYPHAWPYRDYVVRSFNEDKPYDQFVTEQLAGDLLPAETDEQRDEQRLGTGFLAVGPKRHNADKTTFRMDLADDQIRVTSETFLGLTAGCARCHDHKFDPIPTKDYYGLAGIFLSTDTLYGTVEIQYSRHPTDLIAYGPDASSRHEEYTAFQQKLRSKQATLTNAQTALKALQEEAKKAEAAAQEKKKSQFPGSQDEEQEEPAAEEKPLTERLAAMGAEVKKLTQQLEDFKSAAPRPPSYAMGARDGEPVETAVAIGGDPKNKGEQAPRGFLSAVNITKPPIVGEDASGRLELAQWITSPENPLTSRVMVNRIWQHLFGRGLVSTVDNFGALGAPPTHPELLDHLAVTFQRDGWSIKRAIRRMVLSRTYQLSTRKVADEFALDPNNTLFWRMSPRRLEVEPLRDAMLAVSGELDLSPPSGSTVTPLGQRLARDVGQDKITPSSNHRTVYLPVVRHYLLDMAQEFDFASASLVVGERSETTTAQQALYLLNNPFVLTQAKATARLLIDQEPDNVDARIFLAYERILSRPPTPQEVQRVMGFLQSTADVLREKHENETEYQQMALASLVQTLFCSPEFRYLIHSPEVVDPAPATRQPAK